MSSFENMIGEVDMKHALFVLTLMLILMATTASAWEGRVVNVPDGDTIKVLRPGNELVKVRLYGIDCPEKSQDFGQKAKAFTLSKVSQKTVDVEVLDTDRYGRSVGVVTMGKFNLNEALVREGLAWVYTTYCKKPFCSVWSKYEKRARKRKLGLWSDPKPIPPWRYRKIKQSGSSQDLGGIDKAPPGEYHGNINSFIFHRPGCKYYDCVKCTDTFKTRRQAIKAGYKPCRICKP